MSNAVIVTVLVVLIAVLMYIPRWTEFKTLSGRRGVVVVTGASTGIGRHAVESLAQMHPEWVVRCDCGVP